MSSTGLDLKIRVCTALGKRDEDGMSWENKGGILPLKWQLRSLPAAKSVSQGGKCAILRKDDRNH